jgi:hypothetical protein
LPSPLELLSAADETAPPAPPPSDVLRSVKVEGGRRRLVRRRRNLAVAVLGLALVAVPAVTLRPDPGGPTQQLDVAAGGGAAGLTPDATDPPLLDPVPPELAPGDPVTTVPTLPAPAATVPPATAPPQGASTPAASQPAPAAPLAPTPTAAAASTTTTKACRNSADPACGDFRWDPAPSANQPLTASFTKAPATAVAGQTVLFEVTWSDGDAGLTFERFSTDGTAVATACAMEPRYGAWTPPAATAASGTLPYTTTFATPGEYKVIVTLGTADCTSPYGDDKLLETTITVEPAPAGG